MCGRFILTATPDELAALFGYIDGEWFPPRHNIAPTQPIAVIRVEHGARRFALVRWGLVPAWVDDPRKFSLLINARAEGVATKPSFKSALKYRRCLVPATGFYEWRRAKGGTKQPYLIRRRDRQLMAFAGLWERWLGRDGSEVDSACIITTEANATVATIHDRMPVIVDPRDHDRWLDVSRYPAGSVHELMRPTADDLLEAIPVSTRVNKADNDDPSLLEPLQASLF